MEVEQITLISITCFFFLLLFGVSLMLFCGKGGTLLSGYNFKARGEKAVKAEKYLLRQASYVLFPVSIFFPLVFVGIIFNNIPTIAVFATFTGLSLVIGIIYLNTNKKVVRAIFLAQKLTKDPYYTDELSPFDNY